MSFQSRTIYTGSQYVSWDQDLIYCQGYLYYEGANTKGNCSKLLLELFCFLFKTEILKEIRRIHEGIHVVSWSLSLSVAKKYESDMFYLRSLWTRLNVAPIHFLNSWELWIQMTLLPWDAQSPQQSFPPLLNSIICLSNAEAQLSLGNCMFHCSYKKQWMWTSKWSNASYKTVQNDLNLLCNLILHIHRHHEKALHW